MSSIRLIALDLDGTLLTTDKRLTDRSRAALERAAAHGAFIVPATGRIFRGLPESILGLPFLKCAILSNGAQVYDVARDRDIYTAELPTEQAAAIMGWLDGWPVLYDCYMDGRGWMQANMYDRIDDYALSPSIAVYMKSIRQPVPDLKRFIFDSGTSVQKIQVFCPDDMTQRRIFEAMPFEGISVTSSVPRNVEINHIDADKGKALLVLAGHLGIPREQTMAFGDGLNDLSMLRAAGTGVAMANAVDAVRAAADVVTSSCDMDGVASIIESLY